MLVPPLRPHSPHPRHGSAPPRGTTRAQSAPAPAAPSPGATTIDSAPTPEETALLEREQAFDMQVRMRAEAERESNALRELFLDQMKRDDEFVRKCIELI